MDFVHKLRRARVADSRKIAQLLDIAADGILKFIWTQAADLSQDPFDFGEVECKKTNSWRSYSNVIVAEDKSKLVGIVLCFPLPHMVGFDNHAVYQHEILKPFSELEMIASGSYYVDSLAIEETHRGRGIGHMLLEATETRALKLGFDRLSLLVFEENTGALNLYQKLGFKELARRPAVPHACYPRQGEILLLQKRITG